MPRVLYVEHASAWKTNPKSNLHPMSVRLKQYTRETLCYRKYGCSWEYVWTDHTKWVLARTHGANDWTGGLWLVKVWLLNQELVLDGFGQHDCGLQRKDWPHPPDFTRVLLRLFQFILPLLALSNVVRVFPRQNQKAVMLIIMVTNQFDNAFLNLP